eukprot:TRINITY_DN7561_c0_g1_i1.p1 TRINITY_DN7561_c0_g1~~TRINITY_DN7561_c0_g1_i1.p1  ORF type:complete len:147 (+),score=15.32 TRINITY_DN7561_c0_g1_i1:1-441(+)
MSLDGKDATEITNLIHRFFQCLDNGDSEGFVELLVDEFVLEVPHRKFSGTGKDTMRLWVQNVHNRFSTALHWEGNVVIEPSDEFVQETKYERFAKNTSYWKAQNGGEVVSMGRHHDQFVHTSNGWKFYKRITTFQWTKEEGFIPSQ